MARVLYVGVGRPWVGGAGYLVRQSVFVRALADVVDDLHLAMFDIPPGEPVPPLAKALTALPMPPRRRPSRIGGLYADLTSPIPRMVRGYDLAAARAAVATLRPESFDAVFAFRIDFAHFAGVLDHPRLVLDIDDPEHLRWAKRVDATAAGGDFRSRWDVDKLRAFEHAAEAHAKLAFVCQPNDGHDWPVPPEVVPNTVTLPATYARRSTRPIVLFVGNCTGDDHTPNVDAVSHFVADIWPAIRQAVPDAEFHLVGATGDPAKRAVANVPGVVLRGFVDDLAATYAEAAVSVAPIRFGTGTRIKILEALAYGCPVVSTAIGAEGIAAVPGREIELTVWPAEFANLTIALLHDRDAADRMGLAGRAVAERLYDANVQQRIVADRLRTFFHAR
jgi:glycosyltransferase involved in cell wall biosynthesis